MKTKILLTTCLWLMSCTVQALPTAKLTLKVVDESGQPIEGAEAGIGFIKPSGQTFGGVIGKGQRGLTDANGLFSAEGSTEPFVSYGAKKEGYYDSGYEYSFHYNESGIIGFRKWQPWNPTVEVVLKKKINPIALYVINNGVSNGQKGIILPSIDQFYGYDLIAHDWVVPYGQGTHKDFLLKLDVQRHNAWNEQDSTLTLKFSNPGDGLISVMAKPNDGSELRLPHHAPVNGYQPELIQRFSRTATNIDNIFRDDQNYFFRVRTEIDGKGNITSALYGKIHGPMRFILGDKNKDGSIQNNITFIYYLNPKSNDTNLEYDPEKNLFEGLPPNIGKYGLYP